jgi:hypothetical protein
MCSALKRWLPDIEPQCLHVDYEIRSDAAFQGDWSLFGLPEEDRTYGVMLPVNSVDLWARCVPNGTLPYAEFRLPNILHIPFLWAGVHQMLNWHPSRICFILTS